MGVPGPSLRNVWTLYLQAELEEGCRALPPAPAGGAAAAPARELQCRADRCHADYPAGRQRSRAHTGRLGPGAVLAEARAAQTAALCHHQRPLRSGADGADLSRALQEAALPGACDGMVRVAEDGAQGKEAVSLPAGGEALRPGRRLRCLEG